MALRANWKGYLRLSLVSCPIALYPASSLSEKISFNRRGWSARWRSALSRRPTRCVLLTSNAREHRRRYDADLRPLQSRQ
jgi:hypothetical protein